MRFFSFLGLHRVGMPRLRSVETNKYGGIRATSGSDFDLIDSTDQSEMISNFKSKNDLKNSKMAKHIFRCYLFLLLTINLMLVTIPYYRKYGNALFSFFACIMLFLPIFLSYSLINPINLNRNLGVFLKLETIVTCLVVYSLLIVAKFYKFEVDFIFDLMYLLPILLTVCIIEITNDNSQINTLINELEFLKYDYKEA